MIDWWSVAANALWIIGLAVLLATVSYSDWVASQKKSSLRAVLKEFTPALFMNLGLFLFCLGLLATSHVWWEQVGWAIALLLILTQIIADFLQQRKNSIGVGGE